MPKASPKVRQKNKESRKTCLHSAKIKTHIKYVAIIRSWKTTNNYGEKMYAALIKSHNLKKHHCKYPMELWADSFTALEVRISMRRCALAWSEVNCATAAGNKMITGSVRESASRDPLIPIAFLPIFPKFLVWTTKFIIYCPLLLRCF